MDQNEWGPTRQERREARRRPPMRVNGKSVFLLEQLAREPKRRKGAQWSKRKSAR